MNPTKENGSGGQQAYDPNTGKFTPKEGGQTQSKGQQGSPSMASNSQGFKSSFKVPSESNSIKKKQLEIVEKFNPAFNKTSVWIRSVDDIHDYSEILARSDKESEKEGDWSYEDWTKEDAEKAYKSGYVTIYSSNPIEKGIFVTPSLQEAHEYSGDRKPYSKRVKFSEVAWIDGEQGQFTGDLEEKPKITLSSVERNDFFEEANPIWMKKRYSMGYDVFNIQTLNRDQYKKFQESFASIPVEKTYLMPKDYVNDVMSGKEKADESKLDFLMAKGSFKSFRVPKK